MDAYFPLHAGSHPYGPHVMSSKKAKTKSTKSAKKAASSAQDVKTQAKPVSKSTAAKGRGVRYSDELKKDVVDFVTAYNQKNGRGGQSAAARKFKITILTVSSWLKGSGSAPAKASKASGPLTNKVKALLDLGDRIRKAEAELRKLQDQYGSLSASIRSEI